MRMFSFSSSAMVNNPFDWAYQLEELGYTGWEVVNEGKQRLTEETVPKIKDIVETTNLVITIHLPYSDLNLASLNQPIWDETVRQMKTCLTLAGDFCDLAVVHPGHISPLGALLPDAAWSQNVLGIQELCDHAEDLGVKVCVENMLSISSMIGRRPEEMLGIIDTVDRENAGFILDVGHANTNGNVEDFLKIAGEVSHIHIHDNHGERDEHLPVGNGTVPWDKVAKAFQGYQGRFVTEARSLAEGERSLKRFKKLMNP